MLDRALTQLPHRRRHSDKPILVRADGAGYSHALISALSAAGLEFSVGYPGTDAVRDAIRLVPKWAWDSASDADGDLREHADVVNITGLLDLSRWTSSCPDMRVLVRCESCRTPARPWTPSRSATASATKPSPPTPAAGRFLEARHRAHARVEDRIGTGKDTGPGHLPPRHEHINAV